MKNGMKAVSFVMLLVAILATASISWAAGGYQYNLGCNGCHGNPPLDDASRNPVTGGFVGNHQTHTVASKCDVCHAGTTNPSAYVSSHSDGKIQMFSKYAKGTFFNQTSVPNLTTATCSTVNCHFESTTPTWGSAMPATPADCNLCHNTPPSAGVSGASHTKHYAYSPAWGGLFGPLTCTPCHTDGGVNGTATFTYQHATSAGNRGIHFDSTLSYTGTGKNFLPSQSSSRVLGACSNTYCHSNGVQGAGNVTVATPVWGTTATCNSCHAAVPVTNGHAIHAVAPYNYSCELCHAKTVTNSTTINPTTGYQMHTNKAINVDFGGLAGAGTGTASCSTTYCHSGSATAPVWNNAASVACGSCHKADNTTLASNAHPAHLNSTSNPYGPTTLQALPGGTAATSCKTCHTVYPANHANGTKDVTLTTCNPCHVASLTVANWGAGRVTCESCHVGTTRSIISGVTAPDESLSATAGHTQSTFTGALTCNSCHNPNAAHIGNTTHIPRLSLTNDNTQCASCHNAGKTIAQFQNMSTHFTARGVENELCKTCHSPHGTTNLHMVKTQLKGAWLNATAVTITYTDSVNGFINPVNNRGLCQVCHTKTKYYLAGQVESSHPTSDCLTCHRHNGKGGAFKPTGTCDGCHGYPPMPRLTGLTFGTAGNYANARFEDYTGGGGAHAIMAHVSPNAVPADGWKNCSGCHNGGNLVSTPNHRTIMPIKKNIANVTVSLDPARKFNNAKLMNYSGGKLVYPGNATGSCTNVECHFKPSPKWSINR